MGSTNYPGSADTFSDVSPTGRTDVATADGRTHDEHHNDVAAAVVAIETELGAHPKGSAASVAARIAALETVDTTEVLNTRQISAGTGLTGGGTLAADRTLSIAAGGVTSAMLLDATIVDADISPTAAIALSKLAGVYVAKTGTYTITSADQCIECTSGTFTLTAPDATTVQGKRYLIRNSGAGVITVASVSSQTFDGSGTSIVIGGKGTLEVLADGAGWKVLRGLYASESIGRRIFVWNPALPGWQMTFGDTGWRDVSARVDTSFTTVTRALVRRYGSTVFTRLTLTGKPSGGVDGSQLWPGWITDIAGMEPDGNAPPQAAGCRFDDASSNRYMGWLAASGGNLLIHNNNSSPGTYTSGLIVYVDVAWPTVAAWPASLVGTASGSIPA